MSTRPNLIKILWKWVAPVVGLGALGLALYFYLGSPRQKTYRLRATAGNAIGVRHRLAQLLAAEAAPRGIWLELRETPGSEEALDEVERHQLDVALVQGGLNMDGRPNIRQVATLHVEPMHLLVKKELLDEVAAGLTALDGKTVDLSEIGSGTHALAVEILAFAGLRERTPDGARGYIPVESNRQQFFAEKDRARLPAAIMLVSTLPSPTARYLVTQQGYRLVPLPFGEAFALQSLSVPEADQAAPRPAVPRRHVDKGRTYATTIPAFTYSVEPPVPPAEVPTLGTRLLVVAHKDVDAQAMRKLVEATFETEFAKVVHPALNARLMDAPPEFPWHAGAELYQARSAPLLSGPLVDWAQKGFAILAAAASGLFVLWQWSKQYGQFLRDKGFRKYISQVARIEAQAVQAERSPAVDARQLRDLREQLWQLKSEALERFTEGELEGKELLAGFLVQVNDARDHLTRLLQRPDGGRHEPGARAGTPWAEGAIPGAD
jgi:TRAP-type uncharacterized transport system substrate-binding protein